LQRIVVPTFASESVVVPVMVIGPAPALVPAPQPATTATVASKADAAIAFTSSSIRHERAAMSRLD
jgi:hypothetical protein